jgi:hypothetical protein
MPAKPLPKITTCAGEIEGFAGFSVLSLDTPQIIVWCPFCLFVSIILHGAGEQAGHRI